MDSIYIIDLLALNGKEELNEFLRHIMNDVGLVKIGFSFQDDIDILKKSNKKLKAFDEINVLLDLNDLWKSYSAKYKIKVI